MKIRPFVGNTPKDYLDFFRDQIDLADQGWLAYAAALSSAYTIAYSFQSANLTKVKATIDAHNALEHDRLTFVLSLLTVGVGGALAGYLARSGTADFADTLVTTMKGVEKKTAENMAKEIGKRWEDAIKDTSKAVIKRQTDNLNSTIAPKTALNATPFAPVGMMPQEYWSNMVYGCAKTKRSLLAFRDGLNGPPPYSLSVDLPDQPLQYFNNGPLDTTEAKRITEDLFTTRYFTDSPLPEDCPKGKFIRPLSLALWIGWAYQRDVKYWKFQHDLTNYENEQISWDTLRPVLRDLGVPVQNITPKYMIPDITGKRVVGLDMWGFFQWIASPASRITLFSGLSRNAEGFELVDQAMKSMQLTDTGWVPH